MTAERQILVHLNVAVPATDQRSVDEIEEQLSGALDVGLDPSGPIIKVVIALAEEV